MWNASRRERKTEAAVNAAIPQIVRELGSFGVVNVIWFAAFEGYPVIWLVTNTDAEKSLVLDHGMFVAEVRDQLAAAGVQVDLVKRAKVTVESEETVTRDFEGNWWYAIK